MAGFIGPITLTLGQPYKIALPIETDSVGIDNDSPYDVWLYIGNVAPTDLTNANNTWHRVARRGHTSVLPIRTLKGATSRERSNNAIAAFQGTAFLLAVNPGGIAYTGTISARSQVYVTPYLPGDPPAVHAALATATDLSSQPRVVTVPFGLAQFGAGNWDASFGTTVPCHLALSAANLAAGVVVVYLYGASLMPDQGQTGSMAFVIEAVPADSANNPLASGFVLFQGTVFAHDAAHSGAGCGWQSPFPLMTGFGGSIFTPLPANTVKILIRLRYLLGTQIKLNYTIAANIDSSNTSPAGEIGNATLWHGPGGGAPSF